MNEPSEKFVLVVEDSDVDYDILESVVSRYFVGKCLFREVTGEDALIYLHHRVLKGLPLPSVILMDLNLVCMSGIDVVREIRASDTLKAIPAVILSTSKSQSDIDESYRAGANTYLSKPILLHEFEKTISKFFDYWFGAALLPCGFKSPKRV